MNAPRSTCELRKSDKPAGMRALGGSEKCRHIAGPLKAIGWAFLGIRSSNARERDAVQVSPLVWIGAGIGAVLVFVLTLMLVVRWLVPALN